MNYPKVSIVTPSYNQGQFIEEAIQSVLQQDYPNIEYIVVDAESTDNTLDVLKKYDKDITWISEPDEGQPDAINKGWKMASGEILTWLNVDDLLYPGAISSIIDGFSNDKDIGAMFGGHNVIDCKGEVIKTCPVLDFNFKIILYGINYICPSIFLKKELLEEVGYLDLKFPYLFDWEYYLRLSSNRIKISNVPEILFGFRWHSSSKTITDSPERNKEKQRIIQKYRDREEFNSKVVDHIYLKVLNIFYRLKRQYLLICNGYSPSFPPGNLVKWYHNYMRN